MQAKRIKWEELKLAIEHWRLVFLDESGVNIGMTRRYGRAIGKARVHGSAPLNVPTSQTVLRGLYSSYKYSQSWTRISRSSLPAYTQSTALVYELPEPLVRVHSITTISVIILLAY